MITSVGKIIAGSSIEKFTNARPFWMVLQCDRGLMQYYRWWIHNSFRDVWGRTVHKTCEPIAQAHISMVRGETPQDLKFWDSLIGAKLTFEYSVDVQTNGKHWWLPVQCPQIYEIRGKLGLRPISKVPLHLTIATNA